MRMSVKLEKYSWPQRKIRWSRNDFKADDKDKAISSIQTAAAAWQADSSAPLSAYLQLLRDPTAVPGGSVLPDHAEDRMPVFWDVWAFRDRSQDLDLPVAGARGNTTNVQGLFPHITQWVQIQATGTHGKKYKMLSAQNKLWMCGLSDELLTEQCEYWGAPCRRPPEPDPHCLQCCYRQHWAPAVGGAGASGRVPALPGHRVQCA